MRTAVLLVLILLAACGRRERERELADCVNIYRTTYVAGQVRDCLVQRYGWAQQEAADAEREHFRTTHPDSASQGDSGRMGDSARR